MIVVSAFDAMSCGQIALRELGVPYIYYSIEIDKHAIKQTQINFPNTIQLGNIEKIKGSEIGHVDLFIGGSPCQGFSFAGKQLAFDDPRSKLFFEFYRLYNELKEINPDIRFLLENVPMKKEHRAVITRYLGINPIEIDANLVSAQNRNRYFWTNIKTKKEGFFSFEEPAIPQPKDRGILLGHILQPEIEIDSKYYLSSKRTQKILGAFVYDKDIPSQLRGAVQLDRSNESKKLRSESLRKGVDYTPFSMKEVVGLNLNKMNTLVTTSKENLVLIIPEATKKGYVEVRPGDCVDLQNQGSKTRRGRKMITKSNCLMASKPEFYKLTAQYKLRRLTPLECARLQTVPEWYRWNCSDAQAYKMLGNGWTIEVIKHIFSFL